MKCGQAGAKYSAISTLTALFLFILLAAAHAESDIKEGYDENTEITVRGTVAEVSRAEMMMGPMVVKLRQNSRIYNVITAPPWFLARQGISLAKGSPLEVKGSKYYGRDGELYLIGRQLRDPATGRTSVLRDMWCKPLWMGHGHGRKRQNEAE
ncbi:MAG: hypothetical protein K8I29_07075 [Alphaproteobacteria bacterium]|uniref:Magnetosome protein MamS/MamX domain-containing protein n=1 Tax=Candidatus Nitrobium versatile TaxID=2884831 RepID=A0A953J5E3_9BACT|nr:hypothetical protein [Candidatus Nitrobium versatile]